MGILQEELVTTMMNTGCAGVGDICEAMVERAPALVTQLAATPPIYRRACLSFAYACR